MKRTRAHVTADQGLTRVMRLCTDAGWAADRVVSDYGEDLIVQTIYGESLDTFRTLVQVKTTNRSVGGAKLSCRVSRDHALRWVRSAEPVVIVLWHKPSERGWYSVPRDRMNEYQLLLSPLKSTEIIFNREAELTIQNLQKLAWELRLGYFKNQLLAVARADHDEVLARADGFDMPNYQSRMRIVLFNLFRFLHIATDDGLNPQIHREFTRVRRKVLEKERNLPRAERSKATDLDQMASILCLLVHIKRLTGVATPIVVAEYASKALLKLIKSPLMRGAA
jgi:hypothetical protein